MTTDDSSTNYDHPTAVDFAMMRVLLEIQGERRRQVEVEGWTSSHDDDHGNGQLARAAAYYASIHAPATYSSGADKILDACAAMWPWDWSWCKPKDPRTNLIRAGALIVAEIERLDRAAARSST